MSQSAIEWTDEVWNPVTGCDRVSPGCAHCYALELAPRLRAMGLEKYVAARDGGKASGPAFGVTLHPEVLDEPLQWRRPRRVFVNSMSDLFHEEIPDAFIVDVFAVMAAAPRHTFQVLTKRPERMRSLLTDGVFPILLHDALTERRHLPGWHPMDDAPVLPNVWLGVTIENRRFLHRADLLRETPAAVRFISAEPLLGPLVKFHGWRSPRDRAHARPPERFWQDGYAGPELNLGGIDWLIVGGESGAEHRHIDAEWVRDLRDACVFACSCSGLDVEDDHEHHPAFFFKQWGGRTPKAGGRELDGRTWDEFPRAREAVAG